MSTKITKEAVLDNIDFKELSKSCRNEKDLSSLTKQFMKNMIENMLKVESLRVHSPQLCCDQ